MVVTSTKDKYLEFVKSKRFKDLDSGFDLPLESLNEKLFDFQRLVTRWALRRGRAALFLDTGLGKTPCQLEWAHRVCEHTGGKVLVVAPLCVSQQTIREGRKFGIAAAYCRSQDSVGSGITITNYEMLDRFDVGSFAGIVLDESSILKSHDGKTRKKILDLCQAVPYRLSCTATPSPNDYMELGNQAEFLGVMSQMEMLAMFFTHDGGETSKWRLKGHGANKFWEWMSTWAVVLRSPSDLGFSDDKFKLPPLSVWHHNVKAEPMFSGDLFSREAQTLMERRQAKRASIAERVGRVADLVNSSKEQWLIWCHLNDENAALAKAIPDAVTVQGSDSIEDKETRIMAFTDGEARVLVTKPKIAGFGMNWQHCCNMAFVGLDDSWESYYQAVRRCYRFGQEREVHVHIVAADTEGAVKRNLERKERQAVEMGERMASYMRDLMRQKVKEETYMSRAEYKRHVERGDGWTMYLGDCVDVVSDMKADSVGYTVFSPPFASLYTYSNSEYDMGNVKDDGEFMGQFRYLIDELFRVTAPGRLLSFHCMNLPSSKQAHGVIGLRDFRGELIRAFVEAGWIYHSEVTIWKDPVTAMQRTKALGLLWKQIQKDAAMCRQGIPDYLVTMRKPGDNAKPISNTKEEFPVEMWQNYASPVWMDINQSNTLNKAGARDDDDERHICPLQLDVIERAVRLWSREGDLVLSPFAGIGSEGYQALKMNRRFVGVELKESYFNLACENLRNAKAQTSFSFVCSSECAA